MAKKSKLNTPAHKRYNEECRWIKNKQDQLAKHLLGNPKDRVAQKKLDSPYKKKVRPHNKLKHGSTKNLYKNEDTVANFIFLKWNKND